MASLLGVGVVVQIVVCAAVGVRLLALARRTRQIPETAFGLACLLLGAVGYPLTIPARSGALDPVVSGWLLGLGLGAQDLAALAIMLGTARTFHLGDRRASAAVWLAGALFVASLVGHGLTVGFTGGQDGGGWYWLGFALRFASFVWTCTASVGTWSRLKRQLGLGLADPVAVDRIRLWALATLGICTGFTIFGATRMAGVNAAASPAVLATTSVVAILSATAMTLAFFPPARYLRRVRARFAGR